MSMSSSKLLGCSNGPASKPLRKGNSACEAWRMGRSNHQPGEIIVGCSGIWWDLTKNMMACSVCLKIGHTLNFRRIYWRKRGVTPLEGIRPQKCGEVQAAKTWNMINNSVLIKLDMNYASIKLGKNQPSSIEILGLTQATQQGPQCLRPAKDFGHRPLTKVTLPNHTSNPSRIMGTWRCFFTPELQVELNIYIMNI